MNRSFTWKEYSKWKKLDIREKYPEAKPKYKKGEVRYVIVRGGGQVRPKDITLVDYAIIPIFPGEYGWQILWLVEKGKEKVYLTEKDIETRMNYSFTDPTERILFDIKYGR